jgi:ATP-binding protein involved in chromosome partitioning
MRRCLSSCARRYSHENPLGLPRSTTSPSQSRHASPTVPRRGQLPQKRRIANVQKVIAVSSAKGGVGKSTFAVNLALSFSRHNLRTGLLDTDIFGPSVPTLLGLENASLPDVTSKGALVPLQSWGISSMSMGYLLGKGKTGDSKVGSGDDEGPIAWRGLMVNKALSQLLHEVQWAGLNEQPPELDVLVLDLPPGTGDVQLTIGQQIELDGAIIVSTPQDVALKDAVRGVRMFNTMGIRVLGMVRNMNVFVCPECGTQTKIFAHAHDAGTPTALSTKMQDLGVNVLGEVPLDPQICYDADSGKPTIVAEEGRCESKNTPFYMDIARKTAAMLNLPWP